MRYMWCLSLVLLPNLFTLQAQPFRSFKADSLSFFRGSELFTIAVDSTKVNGQDTTFYIHRILAEESGLPGTCSHTTEGISWIGPKIYIPNNGENYYYNSWGDSILIQTTPGVGWIYQIYKYPNGDYLEAAFVGHNVLWVGDSLDWVKTIRFQLKNSAGVNQPHIFNGKEIQFSERFGWRKLYNMWLFPTDTNTITFYGMSKPKNGSGNVDAKAIWDIYPGDEFHYNQLYEVCGFPGCRLVVTKEKRFTISRTVSSTGDSVTFEFLRVKIDFIDDPVTGLDTIFQTDTIAEVVIYNNFRHLDSLNRKLFKMDTSIGYAITYFTDSTGPLPRKELFLDVVFDSINHCIAPQLPADPQPKYIYGPGLGLTHFSDDTLGISRFWRNLVYYQKGIKKWGVPINFDVWVGQRNLASQPGFLAYPQPVKDHVFFRLDELATQDVQISIYDISGKMVSHSTFSQSTFFQINLETFKPGIYIYSMLINDIPLTGKIVKMP